MECHYAHDESFDRFRCGNCPHEDFYRKDGPPDAGDYADVDYYPWDAECEGCGEYVFPADVKRVEAEHAYMRQEYYAGRLAPSRVEVEARQAEENREADLLADRADWYRLLRKEGQL